MINYETYQSQMEAFGSIPMSQNYFNKMQGIEEQEEIPVFIARNSSSHKEIKPTLKAYINQKSKA